MKRLKLKAFELGATEMLTRAQLKNVLGGEVELTVAPGDSGECSAWHNSCYMCCTSDYRLCGQCNSSGNGGCMGNGVPTACWHG